MKEYLSDIEQEKIANIVADPIAVGALKKVLLYGIYYNGVLKAGQKPEPLKNFALGLAFDPNFSNEQLGADLRAAAEGIKSVENGFKELATIAAGVKKPGDKDKDKPSPYAGNPAV